jgi:hypothetical protein
MFCGLPRVLQSSVPLAVGVVVGFVIHTLIQWIRARWESLAIEAGESLKGEDVVRVLSRLIHEPGTPILLFCDNGPELTGQLLDLWVYRSE